MELTSNTVNGQLSSHGRTARGRGGSESNTRRKRRSCWGLGVGEGSTIQNIKNAENAMHNGTERETSTDPLKFMGVRSRTSAQSGPGPQPHLSVIAILHSGLAPQREATGPARALAFDLLCGRRKRKSMCGSCPRGRDRTDLQTSRRGRGSEGSACHCTVHLWSCWSGCSECGAPKK